MEAMEALKNAILNAATAAVADACTDTRQRAAALCPVESGDLKSSLTAQSSGLSGTVSAPSPHAAYVELGTFKQRAQPFLLPALQPVKNGLATEIARRLQNA